jgi:hypothetical protein
VTNLDDYHEAIRLLDTARIWARRWREAARRAYNIIGHHADVTSELEAARTVVEAARAWVTAAENRPKSIDDAHNWINSCMDAGTTTKEAIAAYDATTGAKK